MEGQAAFGIERPRSIPELIGASVDLFFRVPILFLALAAVVVVPYELLVLLVRGEGPLALGRTGFVVSNLVTLADSFLATPLISALHVHAVREVGEGGRPRLLPTFRQSLPALPVVALATGISWVGILAGSFALVIPGLILWARWAVVAQTAALEGGGWTAALERSANLTRDCRWHTLGLVFVAGVIPLVPTLALGAVFGHTSTTVASFAATTALQAVMRSFEALALALLYFDLKARSQGGTVASSRPVGSGSAPVNAADQDRPAGWYIDPPLPTRMRYWAADGEGKWSAHSTKTPKPMLREWRERQEADPAANARGTDGDAGQSLDPDVYSDEGRPAGWYVDPDRPWRMRYWRPKGPERGWSKETTKTPEDVQSRWRDLRWKR